ncbi:MAG: Na+/H+ antiporter subunit E [Oscillospiraceae bacterium]|nr:Na+/H+ antiporter subunit E [Oscillospiraceae bacterium]
MKFSRLLFSILFLTVIWIILRENISLFDVVLGVLVGIACIMFARRLLPLEDSDNVNFSRLVTYPFWLLGQIYLSGFFVMKMIINGARADIVRVDTKLKSDILRVIMGNSITIVPGSITLEQEDHEYTVVWMRPSSASDPAGDVGNAVKGKLEAKLIKAEKQGRC